MLRIRLAAAVSLALLASPNARADGAASAEGTRGFVRTTEAAPDEALTSRGSVGLDWAQHDGLVYPNDQARQLRRTLAVSLVPMTGLELAVEYRALDTRNTALRPSVLRVHGDILAAAKVALTWNDVHWGLLLQSRGYTGAGRSYAGYALAEIPFAAWDLAVQAGWQAERLAMVKRGPTAAEAFAWQKPSFNAAAVRLAAAYRTATWRPFVEISSEAYVGGGLAFSDQPARLTLGAQVPAVRIPLTITPTADVRLAGTVSRVAPAEPPWRAGLLLSYELPAAAAFDALFPPPGDFAGVVTDAEHGYPVIAKVAVGGRELQSDRDGVFRYSGPGGAFPLRIEAPGYLPVTGSVRVEPRQTRTGRFALQRNIGVVRGRVFLDGRPGRAWLRLTSPAVVIESDAATGDFLFELPPETYAMEVTAPGFVSERRSFAVQLGKPVEFDHLELRAAPVVRVQPLTPTPSTAPAPAAVTLSIEAPAAAPAPPVEPPPPPPVQPPVDTRPARPAPVIETEQEEERRNWPSAADLPLPRLLESPVFFSFGSWQMDPRSYPALDRLAALIKNDPTIDRVIIEGRADVIGSETANRFVAGKRADEIFEYLASRGVSPTKLATTNTVYLRRAKGQTPSQRAQDRRVGFRIERND